MERGLHTQLDPTFPEGGPTSSLTLPRDLGWGVQPPGWPYPGTWLGGSWEEAGSKIAFFLLFPRKKAKKKQKNAKNAKKKQKKKQKKSEKKAIWEDPPFQTRGSPQVSSHLHHFPGWSSQICKVSPKPSQSSCAQAPCHDPRHTLSSASSKSRMTFSAKATPSVFLLFFFQLLFFLLFFPFLLLFCLLFFAFLFAFFLLFFCFFLAFFLIAFFLLFSKWLNRFFLLFFKKMRFTELAWTVHHKSMALVWLPPSEEKHLPLGHWPRDPSEEGGGQINEGH